MTHPQPSYKQHRQHRQHRQHWQKWQRFSPLGLALVGMGASMLGHSIELKTTGATFVGWFIWGTVSLSVLNAGLAVFGDAIKHRVLFELKQQADTSEDDG